HAVTHAGAHVAVPGVHREGQRADARALLLAAREGHRPDRAVAGAGAGGAGRVRAGAVAGAGVRAVGVAGLAHRVARGRRRLAEAGSVVAVEAGAAARVGRAGREARRARGAVQRRAPHVDAAPALLGRGDGVADGARQAAVSGAVPEVEADP